MTKANILVGHILGAHGIKGEVRVSSVSDQPHRWQKGSNIFIKALNEYRKISSSRKHKNNILVKWQGIDDRNQAEDLKNSALYISKKEIKKLPAGEYYFFDIIGLDVYENNELLGKIKNIEQHGSSDIYVVARANKPDLLFPAIKDVVKNIDLENKKMDVVLLDGLLEIYDEDATNKK